jgi:hemerythrin-like domain-containing protein
MSLATADLRHEHDLLLRGLTLLERVGRRLVGRDPVDEATRRRLVSWLRTLADHCHHAKEEGFLFPGMRQKGIPAQGPLASMLAEHGEERDYLATLSGHPSAAEEAAAALLCVQVMRDHVAKEDQLIFPVADELFSPSEQASLARQYRELEARTFPPDFRDWLRSELGKLEAAIDAP